MQASFYDIIRRISIRGGKMKKSIINHARILLIAASVVLITIGVFSHENQIVLTKAINVCLECIGIG